MINALKFAVLATGIVTASQTLAADLTVVSFGGANKDAQVKAFYKPWQKADGSKIISGEYNGEMAKVKAMVDTGSVSWNAVEVESAELARGCDEGMFETLDPAQIGIDPKDLFRAPSSRAALGFWFTQRCWPTTPIN